MSHGTSWSCLERGVKKLGYHVCVLGCIGCGKTVTCQALQQIITKQEGRCEGLYEPVGDNPVLPLYYQDPQKYSFIMQIRMLTARVRQQHLAQYLAFCGHSSVQDSSVFGDSCFVEMLHKDGIMGDVEVDTYVDTFITMTDNVMYPSLVVYLNCPPEIAKQRILKRGRECEKDISLDYLGKLNDEIKTLMNEFSNYTFVKEINASVDLSPDEIYSRAEGIYHEMKMTRNHPIISRMGV